MTEHAQGYRVETGFVYLMVTNVCTLKCKHCTIAIPHHPQKHESEAVIIASLCELFKVYDYVERLIIQGGEAFLHPKIDSIITEALKYCGQIGQIMLTTNGTIIPKGSTIEILKSMPCDYHIRIDDYGKHSSKLDEVISVFASNSIKIDVRHYNEENQYFGGWVDVLGDFEFKNYSDSELTHVFNTCLNRMNCKFVWGGKLWGCGMHGSGVLLGKVPDARGDSVDLMSEEPLADKRKTASRMGERPFSGCKYCNGFDPENSARISAAEQI